MKPRRTTLGKLFPASTPKERRFYALLGSVALWTVTWVFWRADKQLWPEMSAAMAWFLIMVAVALFLLAIKWMLVEGDPVPLVVFLVADLVFAILFLLVVQKAGDSEFLGAWVALGMSFVVALVSSEGSLLRSTSPLERASNELPQTEPAPSNPRDGPFMAAQNVLLGMAGRRVLVGVVVASILALVYWNKIGGEFGALLLAVAVAYLHFSEEHDVKKLEGVSEQVETLVIQNAALGRQFETALNQNVQLQSQIGALNQQLSAQATQLAAISKAVEHRVF